MGLATWSFMPGGQAALALLDRGVGRHGDDRQSREARVGADLGRGLVAVHLRHLQVHQHHVVGRRLRSARPASPPPRARCWPPRRWPRRPRSSSTAICWLISLSSARRIRAPSQPDAFRLAPRGDRRRLRRLRAKTFDERVHEHGLGDRLDEEAVELQLLGLLAHFFAAEGGDHARWRAAAATSRRCLMWRLASRPSMPGMRQSMKTTS